MDSLDEGKPNTETSSVYCIRTVIPEWMVAILKYYHIMHADRGYCQTTLHTQVH